MSFSDRISLRVEGLSADRRRDLLEAAWSQSRRTARRFGQARSALWPVIQTACAAAIAWLIATRVFQHQQPFMAPVAAIMALSATRGQQGRRAVEMMFGVSLGVGLADLLVHGIGSGIWQLALVVGLAMLAATLVGVGQIFLTESAVSASLVVTLTPADQSYAPTRVIDVVLGATIALVFSQVLFPLKPLKVVREAAERVLCELGETLDDIAAALEARDRGAAEEALVRARRANDDWSQFEHALDVGRETARFAPRKRRLRPRIAAYGEVELPIDLIVTDVQVLARSTVRALQIGDEVPAELVQALRELGEACREMAGRVGEDQAVERTSELALRAAKIATGALEAESSLSESLLVGYTQATAADVLRTLGVDREPAHEMVGRVAVSASRN